MGSDKTKRDETKQELRELRERVAELENMCDFLHGQYEEHSQRIEELEQESARRAETERIWGPDTFYTISFVEGDGTKREITWEPGDPSVGIPEGYIGDGQWDDLKEERDVLREALRIVCLDIASRQVDEPADSIVDVCMQLAIEKARNNLGLPHEPVTETGEALRVMTGVLARGEGTE